MKHVKGKFSHFVYDPNTDTETDVTVVYEIYPPIPGKTDGRNGPKLEPDCPAELELTSVKDANGKEVTLTEEQEERIREKCWEREGD